MACFFFGTSNFLSGHLSAKLGVAGGYPFFIGNLFSWLLYHTVIGIQNKKDSGEFWSKDTSTYFDRYTNEFQLHRLMGPLTRGVV
jgi:hypothetical protein